MQNLAPVDWLIILLSLFCTLAIGFSIRSSTKTAKDYFQAGRALPAFICGAAFMAATLSSQELIAAGAAGARFGFKATTFFCLGAIPAMLLAAVSALPIFYGSGARTVPEYLAVRFDEKTRVLSATQFSLITLANSGFSLYLMARLFQSLRIFEPLFYAYGWPHQGIFPFCIVLFALIVLALVWMGGLAGVMVNQALQFFLILAGFVPVVLIGLNNLAGWSSLKASIPASFPHSDFGFGVFPPILLWCLFGLFLGAGHWLTDFRILQTAMAARDANTARRIPLVAAALRLVLLFLLVLPGAIAISLPTPQSTTVVRDENGTIFHEITVIPPEDAQGHGLVPAHVDSATHAAIVGANGQVQLNYELATPKMVMHFLPTGLLGLGIAALLASLMSSLAGGVTAFTAMFAFDLFPPICRLVHRPSPSDRNLVSLGRWSAVGAIAIAVSVAFVMGASPRTSVDSSLAALLLAFSLGSAPQLPTYLLGMYSKRATSVGAFAGLLAGLLASLALHGLTLPVDAHVGLSGGWIALIHRYPGFVAQSLAIATAGFTLNLLVTTMVSLFTQPRPEKDLLQLVHSMLPIQKKQLWLKRPETLAVAILLCAILVGIFLA